MQHRRILHIFLTLFSSFVIALWLMQHNIEQYWQQTYYRSSPLAGLQQYTIWRSGDRIKESLLSLLGSHQDKAPQAKNIPLPTLINDAVAAENAEKSPIPHNNDKPAANPPVTASQNTVSHISQTEEKTDTAQNSLSSTEGTNLTLETDIVNDTKKDINLIYPIQANLYLQTEKATLPQHLNLFSLTVSTQETPHDTSDTDKYAPPVARSIWHEIERTTYPIKATVYLSDNPSEWTYNILPDTAQINAFVQPKERTVDTEKNYTDSSPLISAQEKKANDDALVPDVITAENDPAPTEPTERHDSSASTTTTDIDITEPSLTSETAPPSVNNAAPIQLNKDDHVLFIGDSMMQSLAPHIQRELLTRYHIKSLNRGKPSSGLRYPDYYNWPEQLTALLQEHPDTRLIVVLLGANDPQDTPDPAAPEKKLIFGSEAWETFYRGEIQKILAAATEHNAQVLWIGPPLMKQPKYSKKVAQLDLLIADEMQRAGQHYQNTNRLFAKADGSYTAFLPDKHGKPIAVRKGDGIHFSLQGEKILTEEILKHIQSTP
ncbi:MAG: DUF459 domain-containing protein [Cardiobacteriaceae bacterium]|nr:DUF459 domain-containing protein [Cardiobacteriaceae bacterium]